MKNINALKKAISVILVALMLASSLVMAGCSPSDPHAGHDHATEDISNLGLLVPHSKLSFADSYPTVSAYNKVKVKQTLNTSGTVVLRIAKLEGDQAYCTAGNTTSVNYIVVGLPLEVEVGNYVLCNTESYTITSERFGFTADNVFSTLYVIYGEDMRDTKKLSLTSAANIFASVPSAPAAPTDPSNPSGDSHEGHDH